MQRFSRDCKQVFVWAASEMSKNVRSDMDPDRLASKMGRAESSFVIEGMKYVESLFKSSPFLRSSSPINDERFFDFQDVIDPPRRSYVDIAPPRLSSADVDPPRRSCVDIAPPRLSTVDVDPPRRSCVEIAPPRLSTVDVEPPRVSSADVEPPRTSFTTDCRTHIAPGLLKPVRDNILCERDSDNDGGESSETYPSISYILASQMNKNGGHIFSVAAGGGTLYTGSDSNTIRAWRYSRPEFVECSRLDSGSGLVRAILVTEDKIFSAHADHKIRVWYRSRSNPSVHKRWATIPTVIDSIHRWMKPKPQVLGSRRSNENPPVVKHMDEISSLAYNDGFLYSGSWDKTVKVWRMSDLKCVETIEAHDDAVNTIVAGPDGLLFSGSEDCTVKIWRKSTGRSPHMLLATLREQNWPVKALALNSNGTALYAGTSNGRIICWEKEPNSSTQMRHTGVLKGHIHAVLCLATVRDSDLLFSGSADTTIMVWNRGMDSDMHTCLATIRTHGGPVQCIAATVDEKLGCMLFSGSLDGTVKLWRIIIKHREGL